MNKKLYYFMHKVLCRVTVFHLLLTWYCLLYYIVHLQTETLHSPTFAAALSSQHVVEPDAYFSFSVCFHSLKISHFPGCGFMCS